MTDAIMHSSTVRNPRIKASSRSLLLSLPLIESRAVHETFEMFQMYLRLGSARIGGKIMARLEACSRVRARMVGRAMVEA